MYLCDKIIFLDVTQSYSKLYSIRFICKVWAIIFLKHMEFIILKYLLVIKDL